MVRDRRAGGHGPGKPGVVAGGARARARGRRPGASRVGGGARAAGPKEGSARLQVGENRRKAAHSRRTSCAHLAPRVAHVRSFFCARNGAKGGSNGVGAHLGG